MRISKIQAVLDDIEKYIEFADTVQESYKLPELEVSVRRMFAQFRPSVEALNDLVVQLDIDAIEKMMKAGLTQEQAVTLRCHSRIHPVEALTRAAKNLGIMPDV